MDPEDVRTRTAWIFNTAAGDYDHPALDFWDRFGRRTVDRLAPQPAWRVLDACCGTGASALHAAERVGRGGAVLGIDLAEKMLARARAKAAARGLRHATFQVADIENPGLERASYDAVVCVFGIFFVPDMAAAVRSLWRLVRPGGSLAITTWGSGVFEPADGAFWEAVGRERPDLCRASTPWDRVNTPERLRELLLSAGVGPGGLQVEAEAGHHPVRSPDDWWRIVMGSGYRGTVEQLGPAARGRIRASVSERLREAQVTQVSADVIYALARKDET